MLVIRNRNLYSRWVKWADLRWIIKEYWVETIGNPEIRKMRDCLYKY